METTTKRHGACATCGHTPAPRYAGFTFYWQPGLDIDLSKAITDDTIVEVHPTYVVVIYDGKNEDSREKTILPLGGLRFFDVHTPI